MIVIASFVLAFAAGTTVGLLLGQSAQTPRRRSRLSRELDLTPAQREQMRKIWSEVMGSAGGQRRERRETLRKERDEAVQALLTEEQKARYEKVMQEYSRKLAELSEERRKRFQEAGERTKEILTDQQRKKYEELLESGRGRRGWPGGRSPHRRGRGSDSGSSRENRKPPGAEVQEGPRGQENSPEE